MSDKKDEGAHYRVFYKGIQLDPMRICHAWGLKHPAQLPIIKKTLRAGTGGHKDMLQDVKDIICAAERWKEMILEDMEVEENETSS